MGPPLSGYVRAELPVLTTARLRLRHARPDDAPALFAAMRDPVVMRHWSSEPHRNVEQTAGFVEKMLQGYASGVGTDDYVVETGGEVVGKAGFWRGAELGFLFRRDVHGKGLAREALQALIARGFGFREFTEVHAEVDPDNARCLRLLTGLGFRIGRRVPRTVNLFGAWHDSFELSLLPGDWRQG